MMRSGILVILLGLLAFAVPSLAREPVPQPVLPESVRWFSLPTIPGLKAAWLVGAEKDSGLYALRVQFAAGTKIPPHTHPDARYSVVLAGTLYVGFGTTADESAMVAVPAGAVYVAPAHQPHYLWARDGDVVYQESGFGPTETVPVVRRSTSAE
jgi:quercetin dioxygenase-like cupin family protein